MALIIPAGYGEASIFITGGPGTAPYVTTIGVSLAGIDPDDYVQAANDIMTNYVAQFADLTSNACQVDHVQLSIGLVGGGSGSVDSSNAPVTGGNSGDMAPLSMAPIARKVSASLGRAGRGRCFIPCVLTRLDVDEAGNLAPTTATGLDERWNDFLVALATAEPGRAMSPVILHNDGSTPSVIVAGSIGPKVGWIRKRIR